jgi:NADPH:quinone reductase-like Zn-dependent oxidoreductase
MVDGNLGPVTAMNKAAIWVQLSRPKNSFEFSWRIKNALVSAVRLGTMGELYDVSGHVLAGRLNPVVDRAFPLKDIRLAHEQMERGQMFGKIVLNP